MTTMQYCGHRLNKTAATKVARTLVSPLLPKGREWYYNTWDAYALAWREGNPKHYFQAKADRARFFKITVLILMGHQPDEAEYLADQ